MGQLDVRAGDLVRVRSREEILATLDGEGGLGALPFMPEMLAFCGQEMRVSARADKTCDTIHMSGTTRQMAGTVHLAGARCDGRAHGGCQAGCLLFWREEWLERGPDASDAPSSPPAAGSPMPAVSPAATVSPVATVDTLERAAQYVDADGKTIYRCQATELLKASDPLSPRDVRQYVRDIRVNNVPTTVVLKGLLIEAFNKFQWVTRHLPRWLRFRGGQRYPFYQGTGTGERTPRLHLQPGELVEVRSKEEILQTLTPDNRNRAMWFDSEMLPYCGRRFRVQRTVDRIIDESTGKIMKLSDCVVLEGVICQGLYHRFCQRAITPYWREAWLKRVEPSTPAESGGAPGQRDVVWPASRRPSARKVGSRAGAH